MRSLLMLLLLLLCSAPFASDVPGGLTPVKSTAAESSHLLCTSAGDGCKLYGLSVTNGATAGYVLLFDAVAAPSNGAVTPVKCYAMPAPGDTLAMSADPPIRFPTGIVAVYSSTGCFTQTLSATAVFSAQVR